MIPHLNRRWKLFGETTGLTPTVAFELSLARIDNCPRGIGFESNPACGVYLLVKSNYGSYAATIVDGTDGIDG